MWEDKFYVSAIRNTRLLQRPDTAVATKGPSVGQELSTPEPIPEAAHPPSLLNPLLRNPPAFSSP